MEIKVTQTKTKDSSGKTIVTFFANDQKVAEMRTFKEYFCTIGKDGAPSTIRDKQKTARDIRWFRIGLVAVTKLEDISVGSNFGGREYFFQNKDSDYRWGEVPSAITAGYVKSKIEDYIKLKTTPDGQ